nr:uncharacterized protein LOC110359823 isoform X2 [Columba livia]
MMCSSPRALYSLHKYLSVHRLPLQHRAAFPLQSWRLVGLGLGDWEVLGKTAGKRVWISDTRSATAFELRSTCRGASPFGRDLFHPRHLNLVPAPGTCVHTQCSVLSDADEGVLATEEHADFTSPDLVQHRYHEKPRARSRWDRAAAHCHLEINTHTHANRAEDRNQLTCSLWRNPQGCQQDAFTALRWEEHGAEKEAERT